jgi:hypothetical protein
MNSDRIKKPPISISELKRGGKDEAQKGTLSYVEKNSEGGSPASKSKVNLTQLVLAVGLSILLFFVISNFMLASKKDAETLLSNQKILETSQATLQSNLATQTGRIENVISSQATQDTQLTSLSSSLSNLVNQIAGFDSDITSLEGRVSDLEDEVAALGNQTAEVVGSFDYYFTEDRIYYKVSKEGNYRFRFTLVGVEEEGTSGFTSDGFNTLTYYSANKELDVSGAYKSFGLGNLKDALKEEDLGVLSDYNIYVELLEGNESTVVDMGDEL